MKDTTYIKVLTGEEDPNILLKKMDINADRIILKGSKIQDMTKGIYRYNAFILYTKYFDENYIFSSDELEIMEKLYIEFTHNPKDINIAFHIGISESSRGLFIDKSILSILAKLSINLDIFPLRQQIVNH